MNAKYTMEPVNYDGNVLFYFIISCINVVCTIIFWSVVTPTLDNLICVLPFRLFLVTISILSIYNGFKNINAQKPLKNDEVESALLWNHGDFDKFVSYKTPDGIVTFPRVMGVAYPETTMLYRNPKD